MQLFLSEKRKVLSKNLCFIASHSKEWRGNPLPVGDARGRKKIFIYTHPPPFNEISPSGEMGRLTQKIFIITELIL